MNKRQINPFGLRLEPSLKDKAAREAKENRRSLNAELGLLIEEGFKWREMQKQAAA